MTIGALSAWLSQGVGQINQYGWFGWWSVFLIGTLLATLAILAASWTRYAWIKSTATKKWREQVDTLNPLDAEFNKVRIRLDDLAHPTTKKVKNKKIYGCDVIGPTSVFLLGNVDISHNTIGSDCAIIVLRPDENGKVYPANAIVLEDVSIFHSSIFGVTFFIAPAQVERMRNSGIRFITFTGDEVADNQPHTGTGEETQR